jgi:hypothetical protein
LQNRPWIYHLQVPDPITALSNGNPVPPENAVGIADRKARRLRRWMSD